MIHERQRLLLLIFLSFPSSSSSFSSSSSSMSHIQFNSFQKKINVRTQKQRHVFITLGMEFTLMIFVCKIMLLPFHVVVTSVKCSQSEFFYRKIIFGKFPLTRFGHACNNSKKKSASEKNMAHVIIAKPASNHKFKLKKII